GRPGGTPGANSTGAARRAAFPAGALQPDFHAARDGHDLLVHHSLRHRWTWQLLRAADDRRARYGLSEDQRAVVLDDPAGRLADPVGILFPRSNAEVRNRRRRGGLDVISTAERTRTVRPEPVA